jgi:hypothetical protein
MEKFYARLLPFIFLGVAIVAFIFGLIVMAYIFVVGAIVGMGLFAIAWIRQRFFANKDIAVPKRQSRTINHDE